jgi:outer membrane protein assembly factor BamA
MKTRIHINLLILVLGLVGSQSVALAETVREVVVVENNKTTNDTVRFIANISEGDDWDPGTRDAAIVEMVSSGLFKDVDIFSEPHPKGGVKVTIVAKDKHSWVLAPTVYNQPTNKGFGVGFGENNLFGQNKKLLLYGQLATQDSFFVGAYIDPSIGGTAFHWAFDVYLKNQRALEYKVPTKFLESPEAIRQTKLRYLNAGAKVGVRLFRSLNLDARLRGAYVYYGKTSLKNNAEPGDVMEGGMPGDRLLDPGRKGWDVSTELIVNFDRRANWYGISSGDKYQVIYERALPEMGSEFDYWNVRTSWIRARKYFDRHNLVLKSGFAIGKDLPFQQEFEAGGTSLRGYKNAQFRGDLLAAFNAEYSVHLFSMPFPLLERLAVRGLAFYDSRYITFLDIEATDTFRNYLPDADTQGTAAPFKNAVGVGTRFFARSIVLPLLGLDVGYGLESGAIEVYFAIGLTDI